MTWQSIVAALMDGSIPPPELDDALRQQCLPIEPSQLQDIHRQAEAELWEQPHKSWALALVACTAAQLWHSLPLFQAQCKLIIGRSLNMVGAFHEAFETLAPIPPIFVAHGFWNEVCRTQSEIALALTHVGNFEAARLALTEARAYSSQASPSVQAHRDRVEGLWWLEQNEHRPASHAFEEAATKLVASDQPYELALVWYDLAKSMRFSDPAAAQRWSQQAATLSPTPSPALLQAYALHTTALVQLDQHPSATTLTHCEQARATFAERGLRFMSAECDSIKALIYHRHNRYKEASISYEQAKEQYEQLGLLAHVNRCNLNLALIHQVRYQYEAALALYHQVVEQEDGSRPLRLALCHTNMGICYEQLGRYDLSLTAHTRALQLYAQVGDPLFYTGHCHENLASTYRALGRYHLALVHYQQALDAFQKGQHHVHAASHHVQIAELYLLLGQPDEAARYLTEASTIYRQEGLWSNLAVSKRLLAQVAQTKGNVDAALSLLVEARVLFANQAMPLGCALCDLVESEIHLTNGNFSGAEGLLEGVRGLLIPSFPDHAWRVEMGLGQCALGREAPTEALEHYSRAIEWVSRARAALPTERLSSDFFARRQHVFQTGIELALTLGQTEIALGMVEASKSHTYLTTPPPLLTNLTNDPLIEDLLIREADLRQQIDLVRSHLLPLDQDSFLPLSGEPQRSQREELQSLDQICEEYENLVERLRLVAPYAHPRSTAFALEDFRTSATRHLGEQWACLEYFLAGNHLVIFYVDAHHLQVHRITLDRWTRETLLHQATSNETERRELIYGGTYHGHPVATDRGRHCLTKLGQLLLPPTLVNLEKLETVIVVPHGILYHLPFHALYVTPERLLLDEVSVMYAPSLGALQSLWFRAATLPLGQKAMILGVDTFEEGVRPLSYAGKEAQQVAQVIAGEVTLLYGPEATTATLQTLNRKGELAHYDILHFATHAVALPRTPTLSRILLAGGDLTVADILGLTIRARLVTLSACQAAVGEVVPGDEIMSLAQAFFHAGASAVVASLWAVEDQATRVLMEHFYSALRDGKSIPDALCQAQRLMHRAGYTPYQWAAFVAIGCP